MMPTDKTAELWKPLTPAQTRVALLVADGLRYREIANLLGVAPRTVRSHVETIAANLPWDDRQAYRRVQMWAIKNMKDP